MSTNNLRTGDVRSNENHDPRTRLVREKFFSFRPRPLERWLWEQGVPAAAERVFWFHWQEGMRRGDWCSEVPLRRVASECRLDVSTVTRAYQALTRLGCLRRTDPGRDPANPFQQATALTEVRVPRALLVELDRHPSRTPRAAVSASPSPANPLASLTDPVRTLAPTASPDAPRPDPFDGLRGRDRLRRIAGLTSALSPAERRQYDEAFRTRSTHLVFDADTKLSAEDRGQVLQLLALLATAPASSPVASHASASTILNATVSGPRRLSDFELARVRREVQNATSTAAAPELFRQVTFAIEEGALKRFSPTHAIHIALKKIREGAWTRPHRMPPQWVRPLGIPSVPETCRSA